MEDYTEPFVLRIPAQLKSKLTALARADERSLNGYIVRALREHVAGQEPLLVETEKTPTTTEA